MCLAIPGRISALHENLGVPMAKVDFGGITREACLSYVPDARIGDITALLDNYHASIVDGARGGLFRLQFGDKAMSKDEIADLMSKLQKEKVVSLAVATP